ncbi:MAG: T9SS type A sorting domain-containing protein [Aequorivita sp.]
MKNLLLYSTIFLTGAAAFAQLTVRPPSSSTDAFVYVKDQILYVKEGIDLTKNPNLDVEASIYLREGGQLIQGGTASSNSGDGFLSAQQVTDPTNAYAYYYWASPVGNPRTVDSATVHGPGNTNFGLQSIYDDRNTPRGIGTKARKSKNIGTKEGFSSPLTISRRWMYIHKDPGTEAESHYTRINASNGAPAGFGFTMKGVNFGGLGSGPLGTEGHNQMYEFRGRPNNGDFIIPVSVPIAGESQMTLSGNPYPSALDLNRVFYEIGNEDLGAFWFYDEDRTKMNHLYSQKPFGYGTYIPGPSDPNSTEDTGYFTNATFYIYNSSGTQGGASGNGGTFVKAHRFSPIGQGIMFVGSPISGDGLVHIKNTHRRFIKEGLLNNSVFHRPTGDDETAEQNDADGNTMSLSAQSATEVDNRTPQLRLYTIFDDALTRDLLLVFSPQATDGYDRGFDGPSPGGMKSDAFFPIGDDSNRLPYVIQGTNFYLDKQIPITFKLHKSSKIELRAVEEIRKPYNTAYLFDRVENTYRPLLKAASATSSFTLPAGTYEDRFYIVFSKPGGKELPQNEMDHRDEILANVNFFQNNPEQRLEVRNPQGYTLKSASMYDMNGKLVIHEKNLGDNSNYSFYTGHLSDGVYIVKLLTADDVAIDYKAIVMNK